MFKLKQVSTLLLAILMTWSVSGWGGQFGDYEPHGFLSDYSKLKPEGDDSGTYANKNPQAVAGYNKLMIDRIKIYLKEDTESKEIDPAELKEMVDYFHKAIVDAVGSEYPVVQEPGPDVLRLRIAVTDIVPNKPSASVVTLAVPFLWVGEASTGVAESKPGSTPFVGEATIEFEALDSESSQQIAAYIETKDAMKYNWVEGVSEGVKDYMRAYSTWAYTKEAMDHWAQLLRKRLDEAHSK